MKQMLFMLFLMIFLSPFTWCQEAKQNEIEALQSEADNINNLNNISARKYYEIYQKLGEAYFSEKQYLPALESAKTGLRLNARDYRLQLLAAKCEYELGLYGESSRRIDSILRHSQDETVRGEAEIFRFFLDKENFPENSLLIPDHYEKTLYLMKIGTCEDIYLEAVKNKLQEEFHITVEILEGNLVPTQEGLRDKHEDYYNRVVQDFISERGDQAYQNLVDELKEQGSTQDNDTIQKKIVRFFYMNQDQGDALWIKMLLEIKDQYDGLGIARQINRDWKNIISRENSVGIMGVTGYDIYMNDYNFVFGLKSGSAAVISYCRFIGPDVPLTVEIKRTVMQALSSGGFLFGIPRCTVSTCARAYPHSLAEHDQKEDVLCAECIENLIKLYNK